MWKLQQFISHDCFTQISWNQHFPNCKKLTLLCYRNILWNHLKTIFSRLRVLQKFPHSDVFTKVLTVHTWIMPLSQCVPMDVQVHLKGLYLVAIKRFFPFTKQVNIGLPLKLAFNFSWSRLILQSTSNLLLSLSLRIILSSITILKRYVVRFVQLTLFSRLFSAQKLFFSEHSIERNFG